MATLKDHQQAMVDLLASGSGIPASASRLAHAMHDVLGFLSNETMGQKALDMKSVIRAVEANSPGLNDKALAADVEACRPKDTMFDRARAAERRVKELENTVKQLRASNAKLREGLKSWDSVEAEFRKPYTMESRIQRLNGLEAAWCHKHENTGRKLVDESARIGVAYAELGMKYAELVKILAFYGVDDLEKARAEYTKYNVETEQAGCRKNDTQGCEHDWAREYDLGQFTGIHRCVKCGATI